MTIRTNYRCKKCGDLFHKDDLYKHHFVCYEENVSPEEIQDCFESILLDLKKT